MKKIYLIVVTTLILALAACSSGGGGSHEESAANNNAVVDGVRNDVQQYINETYPDSAKKRTALTNYAKALQNAYTNVTTEDQASNAQTEIIRALNCIRMMGEVPGDDAPAQKVSRMTSNTPERLEQQLRYEQLLDGKVFTVSSPGDTPQSVCDFDPDSLPN